MPRFRPIAATECGKFKSAFTDSNWQQRIFMSGRPALIRQRDAKQIIAAAKKAGVPKVEVKIGEVAVILHLNAPEEKDIPDDSNNSFDKIMRGK